MSRLVPAAFLAALLMLVLVGARTFSSTSAAEASASPRPVSQSQGMSAEEQATIDLFRAATPSVAHVRTKSLRASYFRNEVVEGDGSGFVWDERGYVVTNYHVVRNVERVHVLLPGQKEPFAARLVGADPSVDIAVLKIEPPPGGLIPLPLGTSSDLQVGQRAFAIGNPFGYDQTLTTGIVSALDREIVSLVGNPIRGVIQTDAAINPGNSGGPLLDSSGRLIGVNTMIYSPSGASAGIGFAVPVDTVNRVVPEIIRTGRGPRASIGLSAASDQWARANRLQGVVVAEVKSGGAAARAGLKPMLVLDDGSVELGDVILGVDGRATRSHDELARLLMGRGPGEKVVLTVQRGSEKIEVEVELDPVP
jgi:S1-C subfamily serine protease